MSVTADLKKEGIEVIEKLNTLKVNSIAKSIADTLSASFFDLNLNPKELFILLSRLNMYIARFPADSSVAKYYYKNDSIYFSEELNIDNLDPFAIHECIHFIQRRKDSKNNLIRLGLCDFKGIGPSSMAINEAAVQLMTVKVTKVKKDVVKYFGIDLPTNSPGYYPLECNLVNQMAYITGEEVLFNSTINSIDDFKELFIFLTSKKTYESIKNNIEYIMHLEDYLVEITNGLENIDYSSNAIPKIVKKIEKTKNTINKTFIETQNLIFTSYFDNYFNKLFSKKDIENFRNKLYNYKDLIGITDNYSFLNEYYISKMAGLETKYDELEGIKSLVVIEESILSIFFRKIKKLFGSRQTSDISL